MYIEKLTLANIGPHKNLEISFAKGLNGIVGANGAGKSTIVNSIYAALTNDFDRLGKTKKDVVHFNTDEPSFIQVEGQHQNKPFVLRRAVSPSSGTIFSIGDLSYIKGDVNDAISQHLNVSKDIIDNYVFVDQWQMFQFLSQTPAERAKAFQYLCGTEVVTNIHKACSNFVTKRGHTVIVDNSEAIKANIADLNQQLNVNKLELTQKQNELLTEEELNDIQTTVKSYEEKKRIQNEIKTQKEELKQLVAERNKLKTQLTAVTASVTVLAKRLESITAMEEQAKTTIVQHANIAKAELKLAGLNSTLKTLQQKLKVVEQEMEEESNTTLPELTAFNDKTVFAELLKRHETLKFKLNNLEKVTTKVSDKTRCVTCNQPIAEEYKNELKGKHDKCKAQFKLQDKKVAEVQAYLDKVKQLDDSHASLIAQIATTEKQIKEVTELIAGYTVGNMTLKRAVKISKLITKLKPKHAEAETSRVNDEAALSFARKSIADCKKKLEANLKSACLNVTKLDYISAKEKLDQHNLTLVDYKALRLARKTIKQSLTSNEQLLADLEQKLAANVKIQNLNAVIGNVADLFHWSNLPKLVSQKNLELVVADINNNLALFDNPFYVEADEDLNFKVFIPTAGGFFQVKAKQLSGGQKVVLAIAFRLAVDKVFGNDVGMLFLDEPTAGLDEDNLNYFHNALTLLSNHNNGRQIVIITHVQGFSSVYDNVIEVTK